MKDNIAFLFAVVNIIIIIYAIVKIINKKNIIFNVEMLIINSVSLYLNLNILL